MDQHVSIPAPDLSDEDADVDLIEYVTDHLGNDSDGWSELIRALDVEPDHDDGRVHLSGVEITDASVDGNSVAITYDVEFFAYYGCRDVNGSSINDGLIVDGIVRDGRWVFPVHQYAERQSPSPRLSPAHRSVPLKTLSAIMSCRLRQLLI